MLGGEVANVQEVVRQMFSPKIKYFFAVLHFDAFRSVWNNDVKYGRVNLMGRAGDKFKDKLRKRLMLQALARNYNLWGNFLF